MERNKMRGLVSSLYKDLYLIYYLSSFYGQKRTAYKLRSAFIYYLMIVYFFFHGIKNNYQIVESIVCITLNHDYIFRVIRVMVMDKFPTWINRLRYQNVITNYQEIGISVEKKIEAAAQDSIQWFTPAAS